KPRSRPLAPHPAPTPPLARVVAAATWSHRLRRTVLPRAKRSARHRRRFQSKLQRLQPADLVAQPGRFLELQVRRGVAHALLKRSHRRLHVLADELRDTGILDRRDRDVVLLEYALQHLADRALDGDRRDAVRLVPRALLV